MRIDCGAFEIRSYRAEDTAALVEQANNSRVAETLRDRFPFPYTEQDAEKWLAIVLRQAPETNFAIAVDGHLVGTIGLRLGEDIYRQSAEIGYWLGEEYWSRGITTQAVRAVTEWGFRTFGLLRIQAFVFEVNRASARVLEKAGYRLEARMDRAVVKNGRVMDQLIFARLAPFEDEEEVALDR